MDEVQVREWIKDILAVIRKGCSFTPTTIDDGIVDMVVRAVDSDIIWPWIWKLIGGLLGPDEDEPILVSAESMPVDAVLTEAVNPLVIIAVIKALVELWKQFRPN